MTRRSDAFLVALILAGTWLWAAQQHLEHVDRPKLAAKIALHEKVLENRAEDPYQYKLWAITHVLEGARRAFRTDHERVFQANTILSLALLVWLHYAWLRSIAGRVGALAGALALAALLHTLFLTYYHHPYEFWGVAGFCLLLQGVVRGWDWKSLALVALLTGLVWDKHALVAPLWGLWRLKKGDRFWPTVANGVVILGASLVGFIGTRLLLGGGRPEIDGMTTLGVQEWEKVLWYQIPYLLPFLAILALRWRDMHPWVRLLWLYLPVLVAAYVQQRFILHEVRSFWALAPVFTATLAGWVDAMARPEAEAPPSAPAEAA